MGQQQPASNWHSLEANQVLASLNTDRRGLSPAEAKQRLEEFGPNELVEKHKISAWAIFLSQFKDFLIIILLIAVVLSAVLGETADAIVIFIIVLFASVLGFAQEYRAERAMEALKRMASPTATVVRDGEEIDIQSREVVPGDIILLHTGDNIPADGRLIESVNLRVEEAPLTGESQPVEKITAAIPESVNLQDRENMTYMGTSIAYGHGIAVVTATGIHTEFGKIAAMLQDVEEEQTPLQVNLDRMGKLIAIGALALCVILVVVGVLRGHEIVEMFIWGVGLAVAAVPEALPAVVTISLAIGVQRMVKRHALVRRLPAVETLGCTTIICSDKTGTLTQDQMTVRRIYVNDKLFEVSGAGYDPKGNFLFDGIAFEPREDIHLETILRIGSLCNDARLFLVDSHWQIKGDPTEGALVVAAAKGGLELAAQSVSWPRINEIPFSSERKMMTTIHQSAEGKFAYTKGAPEIILDRCRYVYRDNSDKELTTSERENISGLVQTMAGDGLRVLALAYKPISEINEGVEKEMVFAGLMGMIDPPREEVKAAIRMCDEAGIESVMITGDHKLTAIAVARELGLLHHGVVLTGAEIDSLSDQQFEEMVGKVEVYARVSPAHKLRVVEALVKKGHVVAMTGDGVNDAPALKKADIGVAMGITGTDVSKEAADMVLTDDNFASIVAAVEEGRGIYDNIKKYLMYLLSANLGEVLLMSVGILFGSFLGIGNALPLIAIQILWVNLATDGLPAIALALDPAAPDIMKRPPRPRSESVFTRPVIGLMVLGGVWIAVVTMGIFSWALGVGKSEIEAHCLVFMTLNIMEFFAAFVFRSDRLSIFQVGVKSNKWLIGAVLVSFGLTLPLLYVPFLQEVFHTYPLTSADWLIVVLSSASMLVVMELGKLVIRRLSPTRPLLPPD
ncbi:MAG: calcium-transporting P-type ATPase, PMR1-type [Dehalococcoidales bacterium]|nr:calcium-transporting P-type ATPase, PMR1-type [Dehalococcoidales bacterium]